LGERNCLRFSAKVKSYQQHRRDHVIMQHLFAAQSPLQNTTATRIKMFIEY